MWRRFMVVCVGVVVALAVVGVAVASQGAMVRVQDVKGTTWYHDYGCSVRLHFVNASVGELVSGTSTDDTALVTFRRVDPNPPAGSAPGVVIPTFQRFLGETASGASNGLSLSAFMIIGDSVIPFQQVDPDTWTCLLPPGWAFEAQATRRLGWKIFEGEEEALSHLYTDLRAG